MSTVIMNRSKQKKIIVVFGGCALLSLILNSCPVSSNPLEFNSKCLAPALRNSCQINAGETDFLQRRRRAVEEEQDETVPSTTEQVISQEPDSSEESDVSTVTPNTVSSTEAVAAEENSSTEASSNDVEESNELKHPDSEELASSDSHSEGVEPTSASPTESSSGASETSSYPPDSTQFSESTTNPSAEVVSSSSELSSESTVEPEPNLSSEPTVGGDDEAPSKPSASLPSSTQESLESSTETSDVNASSTTTADLSEEGVNSSTTAASEGELATSTSTSESSTESSVESSTLDSHGTSPSTQEATADAGSSAKIFSDVSAASSAESSMESVESSTSGHETATVSGDLLANSTDSSVTTESYNFLESAESTTQSSDDAINKTMSSSTTEPSASVEITTTSDNSTSTLSISSTEVVISKESASTPEPLLTSPSPMLDSTTMSQTLNSEMPAINATSEKVDTKVDEIFNSTDFLRPENTTDSSENASTSLSADIDPLFDTAENVTEEIERNFANGTAGAMKDYELDLIKKGTSLGCLTEDREKFKRSMSATVYSQTDGEPTMLTFMDNDYCVGTLSKSGRYTLRSRGVLLPQLPLSLQVEAGMFMHNRLYLFDSSQAQRVWSFKYETTKQTYSLKSHSVISIDAFLQVCGIKSHPSTNFRVKAIAQFSLKDTTCIIYDQYGRSYLSQNPSQAAVSLVMAIQYLIDTQYIVGIQSIFSWLDEADATSVYLYGSNGELYELYRNQSDSLWPVGKFRMIAYEDPPIPHH